MLFQMLHFLLLQKEEAYCIERHHETEDLIINLYLMNLTGPIDDSVFVLLLYFISLFGFNLQQSRCSIVVSIPACHAGDPGSIPGNGVYFFILPFLPS
ncbi:hypothetical protein ACJIZ3_001981 [Penstemon smallii]|uniref:Uncharacterized protein n=1 Tax=Penstemon smallii TaxID=265156 RepID=A0ABD3U8U2_9LAMI